MLIDLGLSLRTLDTLHATDNGQVSLLMLLDFGAAFSLVDRNMLLEILSNRFSVSGSAMDWFRSYLTECTHSHIRTNSL